MDSQKNNKNIIISAAIVIIVVALLFIFMKNKPETRPTVSGPSQEERRLAVQAIAEKAVPVTVINITGCKSSPEIAEFKMGSQVEFKNGDTASHVVAFSPKNTFTIPAKGKLKVTFNFWEFPGVRNYTCDSAPAGKVVITK